MIDLDPTRPVHALRFASLCEGMGSCLILAFLPLYVRATLGEESYLVVMAVISLPALTLFAVKNFWGAFVDATGGFRLAERIGLLGYTFCLVALCAVRTTTGALASAIGFSLLYGALQPTLLSHSTLLAERAKAWAISSILLFQSAGWFISGIIFGIFFKVDQPWSPTMAWLIFGTAALASLTMALFMPRWISDPDIGKAASQFSRVIKGRLLEVLLGDLGRIYSNPRLFRICIVVFITSTANWAFFGMYTIIFTELVDGSARWAAWSISASTVTAMVVFTFIGRIIDRVGGRIGLFGSILLYITIYVAIALSSDSWVVFALIIIPAYPVFLVSANALAAEATQMEQRAGGIGIMGGIFAISLVTGSTLGGLIGDLFGLRMIIVTAAMISCLSLLVFVMLVGFKSDIQRNGANKFQD